MNGNEAAAIELGAMRTAWGDLATRWDLGWHERRALLPAGGQDADTPPHDTERRMRLLIEVGHRLRFDDDDELRDWLRTPSELWNSPLEIMSGAIGDLRRFRQFVEAEIWS
jgi:hypothetical protein